ncbi:MAG: hypothetical protein ACI9B9_001364, partial [Halioglobus sp.]
MVGKLKRVGKRHNLANLGRPVKQGNNLMAQVINTNMASLNAQRNLSSSQGDFNTALQRLSTGLR